jgi:hypothetical protein
MLPPSVFSASAPTAAFPTALPPFPPHSAYYSVGFTMGLPLAVNQAEDTVGVPTVVPEPHSDAVLTRKPGRGQVVSVESNMGVDRSRPLGWAAPLHRGRGGDSQRVRALRLDRPNRRYENRVVSNQACEACHTLFSGREAGVPEGTKRTSGLRAEAKGRARAADIVLCRELGCRLSEVEGSDEPAAARECAGQ